MKFTDLFIKRPVYGIVISLLIALLGFHSLFQLPVRQYPKLVNGVITVTTVYPGANASTVQGFVTSPLEKVLASAEGVDYITSNSQDGVSVIHAYLQLNHDSDRSLSEMIGKVASVRSQLPKDAEDSVFTKGEQEGFALYYMGFTSERLSRTQITNYLEKVVQPKLQTVPGLADAQILGGSPYAMRIWLDPLKLAAFNISPAEILQVLMREHYLASPGRVQGEYVLSSVAANTDLHTAKDFSRLVLAQSKKQLVRLGDVAKVELGADDYDSSVTFDGKEAVFIGVYGLPNANPLTVISEVKKLMPTLAKDFPPTLHSEETYDATQFIRDSIYEVVETLALAIAIVLLVIFVFLGAWRAVLIPMVTIPLSLVGVAALMLAMGYSINLLTLLAMILAAGLVVDDAIVVVENIYRHLERGDSPLKASLEGARSIAVPVISMTLTLAAVFAPIGLMQGLTGSLFKEFAFTLAASVGISGVIALVLSPLMCASFLNQSVLQQPLVLKVEHFFQRIAGAYSRMLEEVLNARRLMLSFTVVVFFSCIALWLTTPHELAPQEDPGFVMVPATGPKYASPGYMRFYAKQLEAAYKKVPFVQHYFIVNGMGGVNSIFSGAVLKPWQERTLGPKESQQVVQQTVDKITGLMSFSIVPPSLPVPGNGMPVQLALMSTGSYPLLYETGQEFKKAADKSGYFVFSSLDLHFNKPETFLRIDRDKAAELGIGMDQIGQALTALLGEGSITRFNLQGNSYRIKSQAQASQRLSPELLEQYQVKTHDGKMLSLRTIAHLEHRVQPDHLDRFQQLNSAMFSAVLSPGKSLGDALHYLQGLAARTLPADIQYDYAGMSRQYIQEGNKLFYTFLFALAIIFLVLAMQFESFSEPLIILFSVPMSICGALIPLNLGAGTLNIYSEIGLVTLIGLITKAGILMVDFANRLQKEEGYTPRHAIIEASKQRLRPILMTTAAMVMGSLPLILAGGPGAASRHSMGLVIVFGMSIGTLFTLFVVPTFYLLLQKRTGGEGNGR